MSNYPNLESVFGGKKQIHKEEISNQEKLEPIHNLEIDKLVDFKEHIFEHLSKNKFEELKSSIKMNGLLVPIIVRELQNNTFEIMSGHNRVRAYKELNYKTISSIIRNVDDNTAKLIMIDTNVSQRDKLLPSELMKAYSLKQEIIKQKQLDQVGRNSENNSDSYDTREILAEQENVSATQISRYIRLKQLLPELLKYVDEETLAFNVGVSLSFLKKDEQQIILDILNENPKIKISLKQAELLKTTKADLSKDYILKVLNNQLSKGKPKFTGKIKPVVVKKYKDKFKTDEEFTNLIEKLLEDYFNTSEILSDKSQTN